MKERVVKLKARTENEIILLEDFCRFFDENRSGAAILKVWPCCCVINKSVITKVKPQGGTVHYLHPCDALRPKGAFFKSKGDINI